MGIDLHWENELGKEIEEIPDPKGFLGIALSLSDLNETVCLRFIDPYGDTVFNQGQIPVFIDELEKLRGQITPKSLADHNHRCIETYSRMFWSAKQLEEAMHSQEAISVNDILDHVDKILALAGRSRDEVHTYLKFYGD
jgi:hypothetical protein